MRIALLQFTAVAGDVAGNLARIGAAAAEARAAGARLLIAPELATVGYGAGAAIRDLAERPDGPQVRALGRLARDTGVAIVAGFAKRRGSRIHNAAIFTDGARALTYAKCQLWGAYERAHFAPDDPGAALFDLGGLRVGMLICYDVEFPEHVRRLALAGADLVVVPTALPEGPQAAFIADAVVRVRAFENQIFVAYANLCGNDGRFSYAGMSRIAAPDGTSLAAAGGEPALIHAEIDPDQFAASRAQNPYLRDLRAQGTGAPPGPTRGPGGN